METEANPAMTTPILSVVDQLPQAVANRQAIEVLESYLVDARAGRIVSVAIAAVTNGRQCLTVSTATEDRLLLLGALSRLTARINAAIEIDEIPDNGNSGDAA